MESQIDNCCIIISVFSGMSYNQTHTKQFVKAKPLTQGKQKVPSTSFTRDSKRNSKKYEEKSFQQNKDPRDHIKSFLAQFKPQQKTALVIGLSEKFPKLFNKVALNPEPDTQSSLTEFISFGTKKELPSKQTKQMSSDSSDPDWDSDEDKEVNLVSKKIDEAIIEKVNTAKKQTPKKKLHDLQRHEKQFLEEYYRQKRQQELNTIPEEPATEDISTKKKQVRKFSDESDGWKKLQINKQEIKDQSKEDEEEKQEEKEKQEKKNQNMEDNKANQWAEYDPNVGALITGGFLQKVENGEDEDFEMAEDEDFSYESGKSAKSSSSEDDDDDMFADQGPRTITKTKGDLSKNDNKIESGKQIVRVTSHIFSQIAEEVGAIPQTSLWIISDKLVRYKVSTQYMNEYYKGICGFFPYVSLNHSDFVHSDELQTEKGIEKLKKSGQRRRNANANANANGYTKQHKNPVRPQPPHYKQKN